MLPTANFRFETIQSFFTDLGIDQINHRILKNQLFEDFLDKSYKLSKNSNIQSITENRINNLVEIRNGVAHGVQPDQITEASILKEEYINFVENYVYALNSVLSEELLRYEIKSKGIEIPKDKIKNVINNSILLCSLENIMKTIKKGTRLATLSPRGNYSQGKIVKIQENHQDIEELSPNNLPVDVGIQVDFKIKDNQIFYLILE
jgi:hypothetical protein